MNFRNEKTLLAFGENLKRLREHKNVTQEELAYQSNISLSQIARIETGRINPTLCTILELARHLKVRASVLLDF